MANLTALYHTIKTLQEYGKPIDPDMLNDLDKLEEEFLAKEILPALNDYIEPLLSEIQRNIALIVEYDPQKHLSVRISRDADISKSIQKVETIQKEGITKSPYKRGKYTGLCVTLADGTVINESKAMDTYVKAIQIAGIERVRSLDIEFGGLPFLYDTLNPKYAECQQPKVDDRYRVNTCFDNVRKKRYLETISSELGLNWKVDIIK